MPGTVVGLGYTEINMSVTLPIFQKFSFKGKNPDDYNVISAIINRSYV